MCLSLILRFLGVWSEPATYVKLFRETLSSESHTAEKVEYYITTNTGH